MKRHSARLSRILCLSIAVFGASLSGCGQKTTNAIDQTKSSSGQVKPQATSQVTHYAAARFADQVSFGATPELVAEIEQKGFSKWIDDQFALPATKIDASPARVYDDQDKLKSREIYIYTNDQIYNAMLANPDQLRLRVNWAVSQFVTVSMSKVQQYAGMLYFNFLQEHAFSNYGQFLHALSLNPPMGAYLDNIQNRPYSNECLGCSPNENYARELMQLFTIGVVKLNPDGSTVRDSKNQPVETYSQTDVSQLAAALTGWSMTNTPKYDYSRYEGSLSRDTWPPAHDRTAKTILGTVLPAGREADAELDSIVSILMGHQNIAPFISLRLIQHLVTSNPTPAYIARISAVFRNNGQGVAGDMKAIVKAILLDPEARKGDQIDADSTQFGKMREPVLWLTGFMRGMACKKIMHGEFGDVWSPGSQRAYDSSSVFSFYAPTDRAPGSNLLAPEQKLLNTAEFSSRFGGYNGAADIQESGCQFDHFGNVFASSPQAFINLISEKYFRGAMPQTLRQNLLDLAPVIWGENNNQKAQNLLRFALATPYFGVIR